MCGSNPSTLERERARANQIGEPASTLETTQGQIDGFFSQLPHTDHLEEVASVGYWIKICPQLDSTAVGEPKETEMEVGPGARSPCPSSG